MYSVLVFPVVSRRSLKVVAGLRAQVGWLGRTLAGAALALLLPSYSPAQVQDSGPKLKAIGWTNLGPDVGVILEATTPHAGTWRLDQTKEQEWPLERAPDRLWWQAGEPRQLQAGNSNWTLWLDRRADVKSFCLVENTGAPVVAVQPESRWIYKDDIFAWLYRANVRGATPMSVAWFKATYHTPIGQGEELNIQTADRHRTTIWLVASNAFGVATSRTVQLSFLNRTLPPETLAGRQMNLTAFFALPPYATLGTARLAISTNAEAAVTGELGLNGTGRIVYRRLHASVAEFRLEVIPNGVFYANFEGFDATNTGFGAWELVEDGKTVVDGRFSLLPSPKAN
jgi:hypothetical protein